MKYGGAIRVRYRVGKWLLRSITRFEQVGQEEARIKVVMIVMDLRLVVVHVQGWNTTTS